MKKLLVIAFICVGCFGLKAAPSQTNYVYSQNTVSNMFYTNNIWLSNRVWIAAGSNTTYSASNTTFAVSNLQWLVFSNKVTTNFPVLTLGSNVNWMRITNGIVEGVTNAAP